MAWQASGLMDSDHLYKFSIPVLTKGSTWSLKKTGPGVSEEKLFKGVDGRRTEEGQTGDRGTMDDDEWKVITIAHPQLLPAQDELNKINVHPYMNINRHCLEILLSTKNQSPEKIKTNLEMIYSDKVRKER